MKKIYTLFAVISVSMTLQAQTINFTSNGNVIENGSEFILKEGEIDPYGTIIMNPNISIISDRSATVTVKAECTTGQSIDLCAGSQCETGQSVTKTNVKLEANTPLATQFEYKHSENEEMPDVVISILSVTPALSTSPASEITVVMDMKSADVSIIESDSDFVYADGQLKYYVEGSCNAEIFDMSGKRVYKGTAIGSGAISLSELARGNYIFKVGKKTGKFFVK